jgi:type II secretory pathway pseudopilin PulG
MRQVQDRQRHDGEEGFMLLVAVVLIFLVLLALSVAAPKVAQALRRDREVEAIHRGNEYVRAIQLYYRKFGRYPGNMDQLEKSNNIRFLRQKYEDPMTGKPDWRLIHVGEAKTTVKGFFGQPLAGLPGGAADSDGRRHGERVLEAFKQRQFFAWSGDRFIVRARRQLDRRHDGRFLDYVWSRRNFH